LPVYLFLLARQQFLTRSEAIKISINMAVLVTPASTLFCKLIVIEYKYEYSWFPFQWTFNSNQPIIHSIIQLINNNLIWFIVIDVILCNPQANELYKWSWLGTDYLTWRGGYGFLFRSEKKFQTTQELEYLFFLSRKARIFFPVFNIRLYDKNSESDYFFFPTPKSEYFFQQHWESVYIFY
jgi:hypothetical protein